MNSSNYFAPRARRGFTLIELLVVIAIIAILAAILFPVFASAKAAAKKSVDLSNQKQLGLACVMYTNDFDDMFPLNQNTDSNYPNLPFVSWRETTYPYVKSGSYTASGVTYASGGIHSTPALPQSGRAYGAHQRLFAQPGVYAKSTSVATTVLQHPASILMLTTQGVAPDWYYTPANDGIWDAFWMYADWSSWPPIYTGDKSVPCDQDSSTWPCAWVPRYRYTGGLNIAYADGHGKYVKKGALNWCLNIAMPEVGTDGQGGDNTGLFNPGGFCSRYSQN